MKPQNKTRSFGNTTFHLEFAPGANRWLVWRSDSDHHAHATVIRHADFESALGDFDHRVAFFMAITGRS